MAVKHFTVRDIERVLEGLAFFAQVSCLDPHEVVDSESMAFWQGFEAALGAVAVACGLADPDLLGEPVTLVLAVSSCEARYKLHRD